MSSAACALEHASSGSFPQCHASRLEGRGGLVDVHDRVGRQLQAEFRASPNQLRAERPPQARQERAQRGRRIAGSGARPEGVDQLVARDRAVAVQNEVREQGAPQATRKLALEAAVAYLQSQLTAEVD